MLSCNAESDAGFVIKDPSASMIALLSAAWTTLVSYEQVCTNFDSTIQITTDTN